MSTIEIFLSAATAILMVTLTIVGYFLKIVHNDVRTSTSEIGKLKGKIELIEQKYVSDINLLKEITQMEIKNTQTEIKNMAFNINKLSKNVNLLVLALAKKNIVDDLDLNEE